MSEERMRQQQSGTPAHLNILEGRRQARRMPAQMRLRITRFRYNFCARRTCNDCLPLVLANEGNSSPRPLSMHGRNTTYVDNMHCFTLARTANKG